MLRTTTMSAAALLGLTLVAPTSAVAAGETCQGVPATHVGSPNVYELEGTDGPDVIVTNGAQAVSAWGGNDLVCITGDANPRVAAGEGDDVVDGTRTKGDFGPTVVLGPGSDHYTGSSAVDVVWASGKRRRLLDDSDRDVIDGGPAHPEHGDYVISGQPGVPNSDEVHLVGGTVELYGSPTAEMVLDGGSGSKLTLDTTDARTVVVDTLNGAYSRDDSSTAIAGFDDFLVRDEDGPRYLSFRGNDRSETLLMELTQNPAYDVDMGGGDDEVVVETDRIHRRVSSFHGGPGRDRLGIVMPRKRDVRLDLRRGRLMAGSPKRAVPAAATGFEDATVVARRPEVVGTQQDNDLRAHGCHATVRALGGDDKVSPLTVLFDRVLRCGQEWARFEGGRGADVLVGDSGRDILLGGPGRDVANGGSGRDLCAAEKTRSCETRRTR